MLHDTLILIPHQHLPGSDINLHAYPQIEYPDRLLLRNLEGDLALRLQKAQGIIRELRAGNVYTFVNELKVPQEDSEHWKVRVLAPATRGG